MFDNFFIRNLPENPILALDKMCRSFRDYDTELQEIGKLEHHEEYIAAYCILESYLEANDFDIDPPEIGNHRIRNIREIRQYFDRVVLYIEEQATAIKTSTVINETKNKYAKVFERAFMYNFSETELNRIQILINELRDQISCAQAFETGHKRRLLKKLERLQSELHLSVTNLDVLWGFIGEAGAAIGNFGNNAKPFVDRIREISEIVWRVQSRAESLPEGSTHPLLGDGGEE